MKKRLLCCLMLIINICICMGQTMQKHTVKRGETLENIASMYGITVTELREANPNMGEYYYVGMVLNIPEKKETKKNESTQNNATLQTSTSQYVVAQSQSYYTPTKEKSRNVASGRKDSWDVTGRFGWFTRTYSKGDDLNSFGLSMMLGANYFFEDQAFLKFCIGYSIASKNKDDINSDLSSIRVPISINYLFPMGKTGGFSIGLGPYMDYVVSGKSEYNAHGYKNKTKFKDTDGAHAMVFGLHVCASLMFSNSWGLYGEYGLGLTKRYTDIKEDYWSVGLAYSF